MGGIRVNDGGLRKKGQRLGIDGNFFLLDVIIRSFLGAWMDCSCFKLCKMNVYLAVYISLQYGPS